MEKIQLAITEVIKMYEQTERTNLERQLALRQVKHLLEGIEMGYYTAANLR